MIKFKTGERVNFLNESGGGKVVRIIDNRLVLIETDEGLLSFIANTPVFAQDNCVVKLNEAEKDEISLILRDMEAVLKSGNRHIKNGTYEL